VFKRIGLGGAIAVLLSAVMGVSVISADDSVTFNLAAQNNSGESGTATLTAAGANTTVVLSITGQPAGVPQPVHIHTGSCDQLGGVKYPLTNLVDGKSTTTVNASLADLTAGGFAINAHKSAAEIATYVACGNIPKAAAAAAAPAAAPAAGNGGGSFGESTSYGLWAALAIAIAGVLGLGKLQEARRKS
jgi:hypothetical protein